MMKTLSPSQLKNLALTRGPNQHLAFNELARRIRENPASWIPENRPWFWDRLDCTPAPDAVVAEWAYLQWSVRFNEGKDRELERMQEARIKELDHRLVQHPDSYEISPEYHNAIGKELRSAAGLT